MKSEPSAIRMFPCLAAFEATVQAHPEVLGALYTGSLGRGTFDRFSDLDIDLWVPDAWLDVPRKEYLKALRPLLDLPIVLLLPTHGDPVLTDGHAHLARVLRNYT